MATSTPTGGEELTTEEVRAAHMGVALDRFVDWVFSWLERRELEERARVRKPPQASEAERVELGA